MRQYSIFILFLFVFSGSKAQSVAVGAAARDVTPDPLLPVSGGIGTPREAHTQKGNLTVRAMVFRQDTTTIAVASIDNIGWPTLLGDEIRKLVPEIPPQNIMIGSTHTHSAPDAYGFPDEYGRVNMDTAYIQHCIFQMAEAIREALNTAEPANLKIATGEAKGKIAYNYYAPQLYDPQCGVIQAVSARSGKVIGTLVNYAIHPEVIGNKQGILSPDLCGPLYDAIEEKAGGVALFMNGAQGGMVTADNRLPDNKEANTWEECERIGNLLAAEALRIVNEAAYEEDPQLIIRSKEAEFPVTNHFMKEIIRPRNIGFEKDGELYIKSRINYAEIGSAKIITIPGEALPNIGFYLKRKMDTDHPFLFGLTNDAYGYILTEVDYDSFDRYNYISRTSLGEYTGSILIKTVLDLLENP